MIINKTPYVGRLKLKFEKNPHYRGGSSGVLNKIHLNLGFTKLVSRMIPYKNMDGWIVNSECTKLITKYTGGKIGTHTFNNGEHTLHNSFLTNKGEYIGDIETGWWYYQNKFYVFNDYPHGVAVKLKTHNPKITLTNSILDVNENFITEQIENDNVEGFYGYTHRGGSLFKIGDRLFEEDYNPVVEDYDKEEFDMYWKKFTQGLSKADDFDKKGIYGDGIKSVIPFNRRGKKVIEQWNEAWTAAINMSKYLS